MNSSQSVTKLALALLKAQKEMGDATKGSKNPFFKSTYADLNSIRETVTPSLNNYGVVVLQPTLTLGEKNFVETILLHESGEFISGITEIKNMDGKPQSEGSGISYARRYGLQSILNVGAVDDDGEAAQGRKQEVSSVLSFKAEPVSLKDTAQASTVQASRGMGIVPFTGNSASQTNFSVFKTQIESAFAQLQADKRISKEAFKMNYLGNRKFSTVAPSEFPKIYEKIQKDFFSGNGKSK